jgi:DNA-binding NarL/FixJ family response regulator
MARSRVLVVDDHELFRESLVSLIAQEEDLEVVGQAGDGLEALRLVRDLLPDLVLMDIHMPLGGGLEATQRIRASHPATRVLILSISQDDADLLEALQAGAAGFVQKDSSKAQFLRAIRLVLAGETALSPRQTTSVVTAFRRTSAQLARAAPGEDDAGLTTRERDVLEWLVQGASNEEIAERLSISLFTVKSHVRNILQKLNAPNRRTAARMAVQRGLATPRRSSTERDT